MSASDEFLVLGSLYLMAPWYLHPEFWDVLLEPRRLFPCRWLSHRPPPQSVFNPALKSREKFLSNCVPLSLQACSLQCTSHFDFICLCLVYSPPLLVPILLSVQQKRHFNWFFFFNSRFSYWLLQYKLFMTMIVFCIGKNCSWWKSEKVLQL